VLSLVQIYLMVAKDGGMRGVAGEQDDMACVLPSQEQFHLSDKSFRLGKEFFHLFLVK